VSHDGFIDREEEDFEIWQREASSNGEGFLEVGEICWFFRQRDPEARTLVEPAGFQISKDELHGWWPLGLRSDFVRHDLRDERISLKKECVPGIGEWEWGVDLRTLGMAGSMSVTEGSRHR